MSTRTLRKPTRLLQLVAAAVAVAALAGGCGKNQVTVDVDVDSFLDPADLTKHYVAPPGIPTVQVELDPVAVNLVEGFQDFGQAEQITLTMRVEYRNQTGNGATNLTLFFHDQANGIYATPAVVSLDATLQPGQTSVSTARFDADARVLDLFTRKQLWMGIRFGFGSSGTAVLEGDYVITAIDARVVSTVEVF